MERTREESEEERVADTQGQTTRQQDAKWVIQNERKVKSLRQNIDEKKEDK